MRHQPVGAAVASEAVVEHSAEIDVEAEEKPSKPEIPPRIVNDSDTHTNVVVSDTSETESQGDEDSVESATDSVTEQAVLQEESGAGAPVAEEVPAASHPDVLSDHEKREEPLASPSGTYQESSVVGDFDSEATQISNMSLKNPLSLGKPQMAESKKVKDKKRWFGLFGSRKKRKK